MTVITRARARRSSMSAAAVVALSVVALSVVALSVADPDAASAAEAPPAQSCSYDLGTRALVCVDAGDDLDRAVLEQTGVVVVANPDRAAVTRALAAGVQTTFVQAQLYDDAGYGGAFFQITNSSSCTGSTTWYFGPLRNVGWSGRVSSFKSFSGCSTKLWEGDAYTGASYGYAVDASSLGGMNDRAGSVTLR
ncbi:hypothetical protein [Leifsonia sp. SIMBA_070]|uniref:hypothetical protein n=1 Tax=Leifsonia sp. SIMBA_070 TaxID=3085810 RepID=UPI00397D6B5F